MKIKNLYRASTLVFWEYSYETVRKMYQQKKNVLISEEESQNIIYFRLGWIYRKKGALKNFPKLTYAFES